jgi:DNA-binding CsgD family transcriptional regulator
VLILQALALAAKGNNDDAVQRLLGALELAEPGGYMRSFIDEGVPVLLSSAAVATAVPQYTARLLSAFEDKSRRPGTSPLIESLSQRELEVLRLIGEGLSNQEIGARLFLALDTVKGHNSRIFGVAAQNNTPNNTFVSPWQHHGRAILFLGDRPHKEGRSCARHRQLGCRRRSANALRDQDQGPARSSVDGLVLADLLSRFNPTATRH